MNRKITESRRAFRFLPYAPLLAGIFLILTAWSVRPALEEDRPVAEVLVALGDDPLEHQPDFSIPGVSVEQGRAIVLQGAAEGGARVSKHFVCTTCHNVVREDPDLRFADPQARLEYARDNGIPFLQGTTLYGAVNRTSFYNGDYEKKYGDLVKPARNSIRESIQLCATECAQGRLLEDWELESVLAYLWTIDLKLSDLHLTDAEMTQVERALGGANNSSAIALLKSRYLSGAPATFLDPPPNRKAGPELTGDAANGKLIYELSCLHCHENKRYSFFNLDNSRYSFRHLARHIPRYTRYSIYQVARYGTSPIAGKRAYMPNYTQEKMSRQQLADLRAYIEQMAK